MSSVEEKFVVGTIARLDQPKGVIYLVEAFALILPKCPTAILLLVGDGPLRQKVEERIRELQLDNRVKLTGYVHDAVTMLGGMDVFVFPSLSESFGFGAAEAMVGGRAVVASDIPGPSSFIDHQENGFLVPAGKPEAIAEAVLALWADPAFRDRLGMAGRDKILENYSMQKFTDAYLEQYALGTGPTTLNLSKSRIGGGTSQL
jgi:glycosyltransferase involved in cell wall biosynthesis